MSWPTDGRPRFVLAETAGFRGPITNSHTPLGLSVALLDRAVNHRIVFQLRSENYSGFGHAVALNRTRNAAQAHLARLNAEHGEVAA